MYDPSTNRAIVSRDVIFLESGNSCASNANEPGLFEKDDGEDYDTETSNTDEYQNQNENVHEGTVNDVEVQTASGSGAIDDNNQVDDTNSTVQSVIDKTPLLRRFERVRKILEFSDFVTYLACENIGEPSTVKEAMVNECKENWKQAMNDEYQSLLDNNTWATVGLLIRNGFSRLKPIQMVLLFDIRQEWLQKVAVNEPALFMKKHFRQLFVIHQFVC